MGTQRRVSDWGLWRAHARVDKWSPDQVGWCQRRSGIMSPSSAELGLIVGRPDEVTEWEGNLLCNGGIQRMLDLLIGAGGQAMTNTWARLGVGNGAGTAAAGDTDLSASAGTSNRFFGAMLATFPSRSAQTLSFKSDYATGDANFAWNEWGVDNGGAGASTQGATVGAPLLNHKTSAALGTKASGVWTLTATVAVT